MDGEANSEMMDQMDQVRETLEKVVEDVIDIEKKEKMMEFRDQVRETLEDLLPSRKMAAVTDSHILSILENHFKRENTEMDTDYVFKYFPLKIVDLTVKYIVSSMSSSSPSQQKELDSSSDPEEVQVEDYNMKDLLIPLSRVFPDVDIAYLRTIIEKCSGL